MTFRPVLSQFVRFRSGGSQNSRENMFLRRFLCLSAKKFCFAAFLSIFDKIFTCLKQNFTRCWPNFYVLLTKILRYFELLYEKESPNPTTNGIFGYFLWIVALFLVTSRKIWTEATRMVNFVRKNTHFQTTILARSS